MTDMIPGQAAEWTLPALGVSGGLEAMLRIRLYDDGRAFDGNPLRQRAVYVSYRARTPAPGYDSGLPAQYNQRGYLHQVCVVKEHKENIAQSVCVCVCVRVCVCSGPQL